MRAGHAQVPARAVAAIRNDPRVSISPACHAAIEKLRSEHGVADASPFSYLGCVSPHLNLYPEPAHFLAEEDRRAFEPLAFFGSVAPDIREALPGQSPFSAARGRMRVYISFGTAIWRYHAGVALAAMTCLSDVFSERGAEVVISLGNYPADAAARRRIERPNVRVETFVDQWAALKDADVFVTHHGLNSTHEAVFHQVPMLSYPFMGDQPAMARCCQDLGLAVALSETSRAPLKADTVHRQIDKVASSRESLSFRLAEARTWEIDAIEGREAVLDRMLALA
jgi:UDP:flavonoid glycosyltransferase YjiC (YdhE family)